MLAEKRHEYILQELKRKGSITVNEIKEELGISESTIRRDLNLLDEEASLSRYLEVQYQQVLKFQAVNQALRRSVK